MGTAGELNRLHLANSPRPPRRSWAVDYNRLDTFRVGVVAPCAGRIPMSYYRRHVFFCCNKRDPPEKCCANAGSVEMQKYAKERVKALGLAGKGQVRINKAGCLDRCEEGPIVVVYPDAVWYTYVDRDDIDEIIDSHVVNGKVVERLRI